MAALSCLLACLALGTATASADTEAESARTAKSFVDSIGVNVHLVATDTAYGEFDKVREALARLGVHYVRDGPPLGQPDLYAKYRTLFREGIKLDAIVGDPQERFGSGSLSQQLDFLETEIGNGLASLEGPNEYDNQGIEDWEPELHEYTQRLWEETRNRPALAGVPVIGPSLVDAESHDELGDVSQWTTEGNMHPYPGGEIPDSDEHLEEQLAMAAINFGDQPVQATETGYTNALNATTGQPPISEAASAMYTPRLYLDNFRRGIRRTYVYELLDENADPGLTETEDSFGLVRNDFSDKPAAIAIGNLTSLLEDPGPEFVTGDLAYELEDAPSTARSLLLEKRNGAFYLALWNAVSVWDTGSRTALPIEEDPVTVHFDQPVADVGVYRPDLSTEALESFDRPESIELPLRPEVTLIRVGPTLRSVLERLLAIW